MPTKIEWTQSDDGAAGETWNATRGCSRISPGCGGGRGEGGCYAERQAARQMGPGRPYEGLVRVGKQGPRWTGKVVVVVDKLLEPLHWKKPRRVFVDSMSDLFHERLTNEEIAAIFCVMLAAPQHTFQVLTKRSRRMREWFGWVWSGMLQIRAEQPKATREACYAETLIRSASSRVAGLRDILQAYRLVRAGAQVGAGAVESVPAPDWPLGNVWLGVSVESQPYATERVPELLRCPAVVRFVSYEPALGPVDFTQVGDAPVKTNALTGRWAVKLQDGSKQEPRLHWVIVGGESGPGARSFEIEWARDVVQQCKKAKVACFVKQLGRKPVHGNDLVRLLSRKGSDVEEWPEDLRVRQWPEPGDAVPSQA